MSNIIINNVPSLTRADFGFNNINKSEDHNDFQNEMLDDILDLFNKVNSIERTVSENIDYIKLENSYLSSLNSELINKYNSLLNRVEAIGNYSKSYIVNAVECRNINDDTGLGANIDFKTSDITVKGSNKVSKLSVFDTITDSIYIPNSLGVNIYDTTESGTITNLDKDIFSPFYNDDSLYFIRTSITDTNTTKVTADYIVTLPEEIMTTQELNEIFIEPFLCNVTGVYVRYGDSTTWELVEGFEYSNINKEMDFINFSKPFRLNFKNKRANQIKISLESTRYEEKETNTRKFIFGLKQVGAYINYYNLSETNCFEFDVNLPSTHSFIIQDVVPVFNNCPEGGAYMSDFYYDVYYRDDKGYEHKVIDTFPFIAPTNKLVFKCRFGEKHYNSNISQVIIKYKHK